VYRPFAQQPWPSAFLVVRTGGDADRLAAQLPREIAVVDRAIAVSEAQSLHAVLATVTTEPRLRSIVLVAFAVLAVTIAAVGLHGVVAYSVSERRSELGVRMALGADGGRLLVMVLREGLMLAATGGAVGLFGAVAATRLLSGLLFGVAPTDAFSFAVAALGIMAAGVVASWLPARRASRTEPATVLRNA
jgi:putative ABC transport system permease protein